MARPRTTPEEMTKTDYARHIGVSPSQVTRAINRGEIVPLANGRIEVRQADSTYGKKVAQRAALHLAWNTDDEKRTAALLTRTRAQRATMERRAEELRDQVVARDPSQASVNDAVTDVRALIRFCTAKPSVKALLLDDLGDLLAEAWRIPRTT